MKCPNCEGISLQPVLTMQGVGVDYCESCKGVWLDEGELLYLAKRPQVVARKLEEALERQTPAGRRSPRTGAPMAQITYSGACTIDYCPSSGGLWFDAGELKQLLQAETDMRFSLDTGIHRPLEGEKEETGQTDSRESEPHAPAFAGLLPLPNLFLRSTVLLVGLYAVLGAVLIAAVEIGGVDVDLAVTLGLGIIILHFLIGPFLMDLSLRWLYRMDWVSPSQLPEHLRNFTERTCRDKGMRFPHFGIIDDGAPQAFTYGHAPSNARIVISRGLMELLDPDEVEAVVAHELGHAVHWDMFLMTVAQLVPLVLYYIYRTLIRSRISKSRDRSAGARIAVAVGAYVLYILSEYVVLWFSRTREYHADRFAGQATGNPSLLANALVKIAYGLAGQQETAEAEKRENRSPRFEAIGALGIFDSRAARALAVAGYPGAERSGTGISKEQLKGAMQWDMWNPWAKWYELHSSHPLVANRLRYLSNQAMHMGHEPYVVFNETRPESYWDEFLVDLCIHLLPAGVLLALFLSFIQSTFSTAPVPSGWMLPGSLFLLGASLLIRYRFVYRNDFFPTLSVAALLKRVKVSAIRPVPCTVSGTIIGRGVPGYILSEDFVLKDQTGIVFLDYRQPLAIWEMLFGLLRAGEYQGHKVTVEGWYRRSPVPYIEVRSIQCDGTERKSWVPFMHWASAIVLLIVGLVWSINSLFAA